MPPVGFEPTIAAGERPKTYALDRAATGTGKETIVDAINTAICLPAVQLWIFEEISGTTKLLIYRDNILTSSFTEKLRLAT